MSFQQDKTAGAEGLKDIKNLIQNRKRPLIYVLVVVVVLIWLVSGVYTVDQGEQAVIRQFGRRIALTGPGLHYRFPRPIQQHDIVDVSTVRTTLVGFQVVADAERTIPEQALMLTGDENIIKTHMFVQYRIKDAADFLFNVKDPEETLETATEAALRSVVGQNTVDHTMGEGRVEVQIEVREYLQQLLDHYGAGIVIGELRLLTVEPPSQVEDAFDEVVRALEDRSRKVEEAEAYREDLVPRARGEAEAMIRGAEAYKESRVLSARGDVASFVQVLAEYEKAKEVTRERLYLEAVEDMFYDTEIIILDEDREESIFKFLPLSELSGGGF